MSVTLDTNVYVSALEFGGIGSRIIGLARFGDLKLDISQAIPDELVSVLRDDFHWDGYRLHFLQEEVRKLARCVVPSRRIDSVRDDPDDNRILECAATAGSDFILSEDKDLLRLGSFERIRIIRPSEFLNELLEVRR